MNDGLYNLIWLVGTLVCEVTGKCLTKYISFPVYFVYITCNAHD